ncbi:MAG: hypothetical protein BWY19_00045 [bacterium ADurb.Bin212]|nr:MAG: hypothetical protein BWY19_00045 [bacterium ADurb.Bin212]
MKQRGSAILIAVFLVAAVGSASFAIGRLFLMDAAISDKYESSVIAYYAAESGIEEGLLRYRYDKNQEVLAGGSMPIINLTDNVRTSGDPSSDVFEPLKRYYVPSVTYLQDYYGEDVDNNNNLNEQDITDPNYPKEYTILKDETIKLDLSQMVLSEDGSIPQDNIELYVKFIDTSGNVASCSPASPFFLEVSMVGRTPSSDRHQIKGVLIDQSCSYDVNDIASGSFISSDQRFSNGVNRFDNLYARLRSINDDPIFDINGNRSYLEMALKPVGKEISGVIIGMKLSGSTNHFPAPYNTIKSTGHYGGVTRTLEAKIDRQAGTVYDLFDFVLYKY